MSAPPIILILGMHRSGTSCLAGSLEACGLHLGNVSRRGRHNAKGNRESKLIWKLHDQILGLNRGSWFKPPERVHVHPALRKKLAKVADHISVANCISGIKDPRSVLLLDTWQQILGDRFRLVGTFRHPFSVAESLSRRDGLNMRQGLELWLRYNSALIERHQSDGFPLVEYCLENYEAYCRRVVAIAQYTGLNPDLEKVRDFVSSDLEHHPSQQRYVPDMADECREMYDYLTSHAAQPLPKKLPEVRPASVFRIELDHLFVIANQMPPNCEFDAA